MDNIEIEAWAVDEQFFEEPYDGPEMASPRFNYLSITHDDMLNGDGLRVVLWVSGCSHCCPGCQNAYSWDPNFGLPFDVSAEIELFDYLSKDYIQGLTLSGGDSLFARNREPLGDLVREVKRVFPDKDIWLYTGYELSFNGKWHFREVAPWKKEADEFTLPWLGEIDVIVDRPFLEDVRNIDLADGYDPKWCGSSNQRVIDVKSSLARGEVVTI